MNNFSGVGVGVAVGPSRFVAGWIIGTNAMQVTTNASTQNTRQNIKPIAIQVCCIGVRALNYFIYGDAPIFYH